MDTAYALDSEQEDAPHGWLYDWDRMERKRPATEADKACWEQLLKHHADCRYLILDGEHGDELAYWRAS